MAVPRPRTGKILVVDDQQATRGLVRSILKAIGYGDTLQADNGLTAREILSKENVSMVICDWNMPNYSGIELLREVRSQERFKDLPFLMLTAEAYRENVAEAVKAGVTDYICKPFTADILIAKVKKILGEPTQ